MAGEAFARDSVGRSDYIALGDSKGSARGCDEKDLKFSENGVEEGVGGRSGRRGRDSPAKLVRVNREVVSGNPDEILISTSYVERQNLTMRMGMRRFTRLTNGFSKKVENHFYAVAIHFMHYNFCRIHKTLRVTPAMQAGISDHVWTVEEMLETVGV